MLNAHNSFSRTNSPLAMSVFDTIFDMTIIEPDVLPYPALVGAIVSINPTMMLSGA